MSKRELAAQLIEKSYVGPLSRRFQLWSGLLALNWHRIGDGSHSDFDRSLWSATPEQFDRQVRALKRHFDVISLRDLPQVLQKGTGRFVLLTFDDGYRDNYEAAFPILKAHNVSAAFFVSTGFLDHGRPSWWDEIAWMVRNSRRPAVPAGDWLPAPVPLDRPHHEEAIRRLLRRFKALPGDATAAYLDFLGDATGAGRCPAELFRDCWMTWDMVRAMRDAGMCIGGHTVTHPILARLSREAQEWEVAECGRRLRAELGEPMEYFSYPVGALDCFNLDTLRSMVQQSVRFAFSYYGGYCRFQSWNPLNMPRTSIESDFSTSLFKSIVTFPQLFS